MTPPELCSMEPENYKKIFRALYWSGVRKFERRNENRIVKKRVRFTNYAICNAPSLLGNASQFAAYATVRNTVLSKWRNYYNASSDLSDEEDGDECCQGTSGVRIAKVTGIGLRSVFSLIAESRKVDKSFCEKSLVALLDTLQGHAPEELRPEPEEVITSLHDVLVELSGAPTLYGPSICEPSNLTALASACLISLSIGRGESEFILHAAASLIMSDPILAEQYIMVPPILTTLQRSVQAVILGSHSRNLWLNYGVPNQSLVTSFPVDLPSELSSQGDLIVRSLASDGCYLYLYTSRGLVKIGSGYDSSIRQHVYLYKSNFFCTERHGWLGYCRDKLYVRIGRKKTDIYEVDKESLQIKNIIRFSNQMIPPEAKTALFTDGNHLGVVTLSNYDYLSIKLFHVDSSETGTSLRLRKELNVHLYREKTLALGRAPYEDAACRRMVELDTPHAVQLDDKDDDPLMSIATGQDFALLLTKSGKVYYKGKGTSLGYKPTVPEYCRWTLIKETAILKSDNQALKKCKVTQVAVGHEGVHAVLLLDNGVALFTGLSRRGEDGDLSKYRRVPKPSRPKVMPKIEGQQIVYAACNYGTSALVTRQGQLIMFGKDTLHCDQNGLVTGLKYETVVKVALGKAHAVVLTATGQVFTFGINNKGQCGRDFGNPREKLYKSEEPKSYRCPLPQHNWVTQNCRICVVCRECTGFSSACQCSGVPNRRPGESCGCGDGESGCSSCGICRICADIGGSASGLKPKPGMSSGHKDAKYEVRRALQDVDKEAVKVSCLAPGRIATPGGQKVLEIACGMHHTVLLTQNGDVLTFGSNQSGQLGAGDISVHHRVIRVRIPRAVSVAAGSNHTAVVTKDGELFTFGSYDKGALGRPRVEDNPPSRSDKVHLWYATPGRVPRLGPKHACRAVAVSASGDQTFVHVSQAIIKTETLFSSTITANKNTIVILPNRPEHTFKCITINKTDGSCYTWTGSEQVDFVNTLTCLDPLYDVLWCYQPQIKVMKCFNILAFDYHKLQKCCVPDGDGSGTETDYEYPNYGNMKRLEDFKNIETIESICSNPDDKKLDSVALTNMSILNQELAIPHVTGCSVTRMHAALHLLGCLDTLIYAHNTKTNIGDCKNASSRAYGNKDTEWLIANRFESHGGGWGYSGRSIEAIRFNCDTDIVLGGFGLFGGRGDYTAKIKLFDLGYDGGGEEGEGQLVAESEEVVFECAPRDKYHFLFDCPVPVASNKWYRAWASINGPSSDCGASGKSILISDDITFNIKSSKLSNNGTDVNAGQIPTILYNTKYISYNPVCRNINYSDTISVLSKNFSRKVSIRCYTSIISLLHWSWETFRRSMFETNGLVPINYQKLTTMKHQKRLVYVMRACLRLVKSFTLELFPQQPTRRRRMRLDVVAYLNALTDVRKIIQRILADAIPTCAMLPKPTGKYKTHRVCYVQFALELVNAVHTECHNTIAACFYAFFPTPQLKWNILCFLLSEVQDGIVLPSRSRELTSTCAALCASLTLREALNHVVPLTQSALVNEPRQPTNKKAETPSKSATIPRSSKPPPVPPRVNSRESHPSKHKGSDAPNRPGYMDWTLLDALPKLLDIVMSPIKIQMMTRQCGQPHDHGELKQNERLAKSCCKLLASMVAELTYGCTDARDDSYPTTSNQYVSTPSRFMRVNQSRVWNAGNGSPEAICFTVDKPGLVLIGIAVFGGLGSFTYELELLHDDQVSGGDEMGGAQCWISKEITHGTFTSADCHNDVVHLKFEKPMPLMENVRYAVRFCNNGGRTVNGDCGLPSVKGPDGTTFRFASSSLSFNGTTISRGQIPSLLYTGSSKLSEPTEGGNAAMLLSAQRAMTMKVASIIMERSAELFCTLRNELTAEDLRRNAAVLQSSPAILTLLPFTLANLEGLNDSKSTVQLLEIIHKLLPHVAAMNLLLPSSDDSSSTPAATTARYYTWVESDHPYKQATVNNTRVLFPRTVSWVVLEMDPRSITSQPEDSLTIYAVAGSPKQRCHCLPDKPEGSPFRKRIVQLTNETGDVVETELCDDAADDAQRLHYNCSYVAVTPKLSHLARDWPKDAIIVPGNEVIFSLESASDYLNEYSKSDRNESQFGYRCLCVGYEDAAFASQRQGMLALEMELAYSGAACASRLLAPDLDIPPIEQSTVAEILKSSLRLNMTEAVETVQDSNEAQLLSRGLALSSTPTVHQVLEGQPLSRCMSAERQFLADFVAANENTAGGRLARWLGPIPQVEPSKCKLKPPEGPLHPLTEVIIQVIVKDQYNERVTSSALRAEVMIQRLEEVNLRKRSALIAEAQSMEIPDEPYKAGVKDSMRFQAITFAKELRFASGVWGDPLTGGNVTDADRVTTEKYIVRLQEDGTYVTHWTPKVAGNYILKCSLDNQISPQELALEVYENDSNPCGEGMATPSTPVKLRRYLGKYTSGLRVRASPSLQAEESGVVFKGACISIIEEVENKDGIWVRLSSESINAFAEDGGPIAWCLQYHRHLDLLLLEPMESWTSGQATYEWNGMGDSQGEFHQWEGESSGENVTEDIPPLAIEQESKPASGPSESNDSDCSGNSTVDAQAQEQKDTNVPTGSCHNSPQKKIRNNGNSIEELSTDVSAKQSVENVPDVNNVKVEEDKGTTSTQAETQTSPEVVPETATIQPEPATVAKEPIARPIAKCRRRSRKFAKLETSPPPLPTRSNPPPPKKSAISPSQGECMRAVFAAILWHEGIVHDAIAGSAFLKFYPKLPKDGAKVVTRTPTAELVAQRHQRHSVEVSSASQYLRIQQSTLDTLTRSGMEATASRARRVVDESLPISEEDTQSNDNDGEEESKVHIVNVLPPALRALVALWDALSSAPTLSSATDRCKIFNRDKDNAFEIFSNMKKRRVGKQTTFGQAFYYVGCELCGISVLPPLITHLKESHKGCRSSTIHGYTHGGIYKRADAYAAVAAPDSISTKTAPCGTVSKSYQLLYMFCEKCRDKALKATSSKHPKLKEIGEGNAEPINEFVDHKIIKENALFLLELNPLNANTENMSDSPWNDSNVKLENAPTPPGSMWQPAPPFQCFSSFNDNAEAGPSHYNEATKYHSLGRPRTSAAAAASTSSCYDARNTMDDSPLRRVQRSVSMSQAGDFANAVAGPSQSEEFEKPPLIFTQQETLSGGKSSLVSQPTTALLHLVGCDEWNLVSPFEPPTVDAEDLLKKPVLTFVMTKRDLDAVRERLDAAIKINTVRQYSFEALNWLLRSVTQPTCVHDVMWWFCGSLQKYARLSPTLTNSGNSAGRQPVVSRTANTASAAALCPGGRSGSGSRMALHAFLGSVSILAPNLPPGGAATLQAVRCWALNYSPHDRIFLHRSQVFTVISKILSNAEDSNDDSLVGAFHDSIQSNANKESFIWSCPDITNWCDVSVSSRQAMAGALTDGTSETFWESGDEDRNRAKWIQIFYPGAAHDDRPHLVCIHLDNTRDTAFKTLLLSFLYSEGSRELYHVQDIDVDSKAAAWFCCPLPRVTGLALRVRCELRGPDPSARIRQIRVLSAPAPVPSAVTPTPAQLLHTLVEAETLRVFRLVTSQVFGKLLEWDQGAGSESEAENVTGPVSPNVDVDDSHLREHVVGILFSGHKFTQLQCQVMSHIVAAIGCEAARSRDDWETSLMCTEAAEHADEEPNPPGVIQVQDNYCFEMLSLLLALSGSAVGCAHLSQKTELLGDLLGLLHTGTERVQRQVISLLRRMICEITPLKVLAAINVGRDMYSRITLIDHLVSYLSKALTIQVKVKGGAGGNTPTTAIMGSSIAQSPPVHWFMRGKTSKKHAHLVAKLLTDMVEGKVSEAWRLETRGSLAKYAVRLATMAEPERIPSKCLSNPTMWLALASLCVCEDTEIVNNRTGARSRDSLIGSRSYCTNHDDDETVAIIDCTTCGALCPECDRFLHLNRASRNHHRQICKEEESAIRIDVHEGCGRAKLFWLLLLVDRRTLKGLAEFRGVGGRIGEPSAASVLVGPPGPAGMCRFCGARSNTGLLAIGNICSDIQCQEHGQSACTITLRCGHLCCGVREERQCMPCLYGCAPPVGQKPLRQDADDMCMICFTDPLQAAPAVQLKCGHVFHLHCCKNALNSKWNGPRITFSFSQCPICKVDMEHWSLDELLNPIRELRDEVRRKALMRLEYEGVSAAEASRVKTTDPSQYAMERYAYYVCFKCGKAYFGGLARCEAEASGHWEPNELICGACSDVNGAHVCPKHGADFLEYKCKYCCSVAVFFCFGTSHFCNTCHDDFQRVTTLPKNMLPNCPAGPKGEQLPGTSDECPLRVKHPPTGEEFALGCGVCRHAQGF